MKIFTVEFWNYAGERAIKTFAQSAVAVIGAGTVGLFSIDVAALVSVSAGAALMSILTSITLNTK